MSEQKDLEFRPVTEGLGFHPFSDGLPYAPVSKPAKTGAPDRETMARGAGAVAAGRPRYSAINIPIATQARQPAPTKEIAEEIAENPVRERFGVLYMFKRIFAHVLDTSLNIAICAAALVIVLARIDLEPLALLDEQIFILSIPFLLFFSWALITAQEVAFGTTVGKKVFGLYLEGGALVLFLRAILFVPSVLFGGVGLLWALFTRRRQCWHDLFSGIQPHEVARL